MTMHPFQARLTTSQGGVPASSSATATADVATHRATGEPIPPSEQLMQVDQAITLTLQEIDANFAKSHQIITGKILPSIRRYGIASHNTWQGARFWHRFFETASDINLVPTYDEEGTVAQEASSTSFSSQDQGAAEASQSSPYSGTGRSYGAGDDSTEDGGPDDSGELDEREFEPPRLSDASVAATARLNRGGQKSQLDRDDEGDDSVATWAPVESHFEKLKREVDNDFSTNEATASGERQASTTPKRTAGGSRLATQVLRSQHEQQRKSAQKVQATPKRGTANRGNPFTSGKKAEQWQRENGGRWNGIADLRKTPLAKAKASKGKGKGADQGGEDDSIDSLAWPPAMSPPVTMQFSVPRSKYSKTPAKEAARYMVDGLLRTVDDASPATRQRTRRQQEQGIPITQKGRSAAGGLVSTPLRKGPTKGRKSLPTPPTVTKRFGADRLSRGGREANSPAGLSSAAKLLDEDEGGEESGEGLEEEVNLDLGTGLSKLALSQTSADIDKLLRVNEDDDDEDDSSGEEEESESDEDEQEIRPPLPHQSSTAIQRRNGSDYPTASSLSSNSRSIDQDTLFGIRDPKKTTSGGPGPSALHTATSHFSSSDPPTQSSKAQTYEPMGARLYEQGTVYGGRPILGDDREDTFSAPSPTPPTATSRRSK